MSRCIIIEHVNITCLFVPSKEIKVAVFHQTNTKILIKETLRTKNNLGRAIDDKRAMEKTNMTVFSISKTPQATSDQTFDN